MRRIQHLLKVEKYTIEGARQVLARENSEGDREDLERDLLALRRFLEELLQKL